MTVAAEAKKSFDLSVSVRETNFLSPLLREEKSLASEYRLRKNSYDWKAVHPADILAAEEDGWSVQRAGKRVARLKRIKSHDKWVEDRVGCLLHGMATEP